MTFSEYLKSKIKERSFSYRKLAYLAGVDHTYISKIINGKIAGPPSPDIIRKLSKPLGVPYEDMMIAAGYIDNKHTQNETRAIDDPEIRELMETVSILLRCNNKLSKNDKNEIIQDTSRFFRFLVDEKSKE